MTEERKKILEMLAAGQITTDEADRLLDAVQGAPASATATAPEPKKAPKYLRVMVDANDRHDGGPVHINIRVPVMLLRAGVRLASLMPPKAQERVNEALHEQGMDFDVSQIKPENINELIDQLQDFSVDIDHKQDDVKVKIFAE